MDISIVVPTYNRKDIVARTLETLFKQDYPSDRYEVIVVVDGSTDGTAEYLRELRSACRFRVIEQENAGGAGARNTGFRAAVSELILFLDDDMLCEPQLLAEHVQAHRGCNRSVVFGSIFLSADSPSSLASECFKEEIGSVHLKWRQNAETEWKLEDCVFANTSLPRKLLEEMSGFNESFRMREDLELGIRLFAAGADPKYVGSAVAHQYYGKAASDLIREAEVFAVSDVQFARMYPGVLVSGQLNWLAARRPKWKTRCLRILAALPGLPDLLLVPICSLSQRFFRFARLRKAGVRALTFRRRIYWFHKVMKLGWTPYESNRVVGSSLEYERQ